MSRWFERKPRRCRSAQESLHDLLNSAAAAAPEELLASAGAETRAHLADCAGCRAAFDDALSVRRLLRGCMRAAEDPGPEFTAKVMRAIAPQSPAQTPASNPWFAVPALAARFAWVSAIVLLLVTTWLYERHPAGADHRAASDSAGSVLEPSPQPSSQDEVLASLVGREP